MLTLLYSGNLGLGHDLDTIILAVAGMNGHAAFKAVFVGEGKAKNQLQKQVRELQLDNIEFRPPVPLYKLPALLAEGDIHFVSQRQGTQGFIVPSKIYGVLAAGRPSIFIGPPDCEPAIIVSESKSGFVILPGDVDSAVDAMKKLISDSKMRLEMGKLAKSYYQQRFGRKKSIASIINVIEALTQPDG